MLDRITTDIQYHIFSFLETFDLCACIIAHRDLRVDTVWIMKYAELVYGKKFWKIAAARPTVTSNPLGNTMQELMRIERFQRLLVRNGYPRWTLTDFVKWWQLADTRVSGMGVSQLQKKTNTCKKSGVI